MFFMKSSLEIMYVALLLMTYHILFIRKTPDMRKAVCVHALNVGNVTLKTQGFSSKTPHLQIIANF